MIKETHRWPIKSSALNQAHALDCAFDGVIFPDCVIRERFFCFTISKIFHEVTLLWFKISLAGYGMGFKMKARCRVTKHLRRDTD